MSQHYSSAQTTTALSMLKILGMNIQDISQKVKRPIRTLYAWHKESPVHAQTQQNHTQNSLAAKQNLQQLLQNSQFSSLIIQLIRLVVK